MRLRWCAKDDVALHCQSGIGPTPNWDASRRQSEIVCYAKNLQPIPDEKCVLENPRIGTRRTSNRVPTMDNPGRLTAFKKNVDANSQKGERSCSKQGHNFESTACRVLRAMSPRYDLRCQAPEVELVNSKPVRNKPPTHPHLNSSSRTRGHIAAAGLLARRIRCSINLKEHKRVT